MIGRLLSIGEHLAGQRDPRFYKGLAFSALEGAASAAGYGAVYVFLRDAFAGRLTGSETALVTLVLVALAGVQIAFARPAMENIFNAAYSLMGHARIRMTDHVRKLPMGFFTKARSGELAGVLTTDIGLVEDIWAHLFGVFAGGLVVPLLVSAGLILLDWRLGLALLATLPLSFVVLGLAMPIIGRQLAHTLEALSDANARIVEYIRGIAVLRTFGRHGEGYARVVNSMERLRDALIRTEVAPAPLLSVFGLTVEMGFVLVALTGSYLLLGGSLSPDTLLLFLLVAIGVSRKLADFGTGLLVLRVADAALKRIDALLSEAPLAEPSTPAPELVRFDIELDNVSFGYEKSERVLHGVQAILPARQLTALVGPSGSGKSTLVHLIARLWDTARGDGAIRIGGTDLRDIPFETLHRHIAMVFQDVVLFSGSVLENIRVGRPNASRDEVIAAAKEAQAHTFIEALPNGYDTALGEGGDTLSGGEKQRISIARAILKDAPIVLLDEATASVDATSEREIQGAIDRLVRRKTVVVIAHRLRTIQRADQILVLAAGRIAERGQHEELLALGGIYAKLWNDQDHEGGWSLSRAALPNASTLAALPQTGE